MRMPKLRGIQQFKYVQNERKMSSTMRMPKCVVHNNLNVQNERKMSSNMSMPKLHGIQQFKRAQHRTFEIGVAIQRV